MNNDIVKLIIFFGLIGFLLWRNLPGALAFLRPAWIRCRAAGGPAELQAGIRGAAMREMVGELEELGFQPLGVNLEQRPLSRPKRELIFASSEHRAFASVSQVRNEAWLYYVTQFADGATVITADYRWPSVDEKDYLAGGLPAGSPLEILNTHQRRVQRFLEEGHGLDERYTLEARGEGCRAFYAQGPGRREVRRREAKGMMFTAVALIWIGMVVAGVFSRR